LPATISPDAPIDVAINEMRIRHQPMLIVQDKEQVVGLISFEDLVSERPLRMIQEKGLTRAEITVDLLMSTCDQVLTIDSRKLRHALVGHILKTIKDHSAYYILVIKKQRHGKHVIKGLFSASQIGRQLHLDLSAILEKSPETIVDLHQERKG
jgi:hypothetical protein